MTAGWEITDAKSGPAGGQTWTLQAPDEPGRSQLDLMLAWAEGRAGYAVPVDVAAR